MRTRSVTPFMSFGIFLSLKRILKARPAHRYCGFRFQKIQYNFTIVKIDGTKQAKYSKDVVFFSFLFVTQKEGHYSMDQQITHYNIWPQLSLIAYLLFWPFFILWHLQSGTCFWFVSLILAYTDYNQASFLQMDRSMTRLITNSTHPTQPHPTPPHFTSHHITSIKLYHETCLLIE